MDNYDHAAEKRQAALDYLNRHPMQSCLEISEALGISNKTLQGALRYMSGTLREVEKIGKGKATKYRAIATQTVSADEIRRRVAEAQERKGSKPASVKIGNEPWRYQHEPGKLNDGFPISGQGGQGNLRREFGIQSVMA